MDASQFARQHFGGVALNDKRLSERAVKIAAGFARAPGESIPRVFKQWSQTKAAYAFFKNEQATPDCLQAPHRAMVHEQMQKSGRYLLIEDTCDMSFSRRAKKIKGLGPIGEGKGRMQGFLLHSVLAVRVDAEGLYGGQMHRKPLDLLGLASQQYWVRKPRPKGEKAHDSWADKKRERESQIWPKATELLGNAPNDDQVRWVRVCDSGADIYDHMLGCVEAGHGYVIRACYDRSLLGEPEHHRLLGLARWLEDKGHFDLQLRARAKTPARKAELVISWKPIRIRSPQAPQCSPGTRPEIECTLVHVMEVNAGPEVSEPLEWVLLTDEPIETLEQAFEVVLEYASRWCIEDYHKALKTGLGAEELQLETADRLFAAIAIMSVVALRLVDLRERTRLLADAPAQQSGLTPLELDILSKLTAKPLTSVADVALAIARLGGHLGRKHDGMPGMLTLWHGMNEFVAIMRGVHLALGLAGTPYG